VTTVTAPDIPGSVATITNVTSIDAATQDHVRGG
jgi:hypothetical protein